MTPTHPVRSGVLALVKSAVVALGVPGALIKLWVSLPPVATRNPWLSEALWIRVVFILVALIWVRALASLARELRGAFTGVGSPSGTSWSTRWAGAIAALVLLLSSTHVLSSSRAVRSPRAVNVVASATPMSREASAFAVVATGECLADIAERHIGTRDAWALLARLNFGLPQTGGARFVDASLIRSGWCLLLPQAVPAVPDSPRSTNQHPRQMLEELALLGLGVVTTAALVRRLAALHVAARSSRNFREGLLPADSDLCELAAAITPFGDAPLIDWIDAANRLVSLVATRETVRPEIRIVRAGPDGVAIYLAQGIECDASPFVVTDHGHRWTLPLAASPHRIQTLTEGHPRWAPWLVPIGDDGEDAWLLAVGPGRWLSLVGTAEQTDAVLAGLIVGLRMLPWAEELQVELLDVAPPSPSERCYQLVASSPAVLAELLIEPRHDRHEDSMNTWQRELLVVLGPDALVPKQLKLAQPRVGVISVGEAGSDRLVLDDGRCVLEPIGVELRVPAPDSRALVLIERLVDRAAAEPYLIPLEPPPEPRSGRSRPVLQVVRLQLLGGEPRVIGLAGLVAPRDEPRLTELLAYLALHPRGVDRERLEHALFPYGGVASASRLTDLLATLRSALAARAPHIPCISLKADEIALEVVVPSDWLDLLEALSAARHAAGPEARALLESALRSEPLPPGEPYRWMTSESLISELSFRLCDGWHQLGLLAAAESQLDAAEAAVRAGLRVEPTSELLVRDLMVLRDAVHDRAGVFESYERLESALVAVGGSEPALATRQLFVQLTHPSHRAG